MNRCLILIGNQGNPADGSFLPGVSQDIERYLEFFRSDFGGAWDDREIASRKYGWSRMSLHNELFSRRMNEGLDYALIVFAGHGYAERNGNVYFELSPGEEVSLSEIKALLPNQKMLMIADSCQGYLEQPLSKSLTECVRSFSAGGRIMDSREIKRRRYDNCIERMLGSSKAFASAVSPGEYAGDTSKGGRYSRTLMDHTERVIESGPPRADILIDAIHSLAADDVARISGGLQHPRLILDRGETYPPFLIL